MTMRIAASLVLALGLWSCTSAPEDPRFVRSCRGEYVDACRPHTYARITEAMLSPEQIVIGDPAMRAHVTVSFETCEMAPALPRIELAAIIGDLDGGATPPDGGSSVRVVPLATIAPPTDPTATSVDVMIDNPFFADIPPNDDIVLSFTPVIDGCGGDGLRQSYHTGPFASP